MAYTNIDDPSAHFQAFTFTGNGSTRTITLDGNSDLQPDFYWFKTRSNATYGHYWMDSSRGVTKFLASSATVPDITNANILTSFNSNGVSVTGAGDINGNGTEMANWVWKANGGTTSTNTDGTLSTTVQANQDAGFSIVQWTGVGAIRTVGHGLGQAPAMVICKNRTLSTQWLIWHQGLTGPGYELLFTTGAMGGPGGNLVRQTPTSTVFEIGTSVEVSNDCIAYCFAEKQGYSKFGKYVGNGNANGTFIYTGFKPAWVMIKRIDSADSWAIFDNKRSDSGGFNVIDKHLRPDSNTAELDPGGSPAVQIDTLSNGFKQREANGQVNASGGSYIYMAFAENPFTTSTGIPTTAR